MVRDVGESEVPAPRPEIRSLADRWVTLDRTGSVGLDAVAMDEILDFLMWGGPSSAAQRSYVQQALDALDPAEHAERVQLYRDFLAVEALGCRP